MLASWFRVWVCVRAANGAQPVCWRPETSGLNNSSSTVGTEFIWRSYAAGSLSCELQKALFVYDCGSCLFSFCVPYMFSGIHSLSFISHLLAFIHKGKYRLKPGFDNVKTCINSTLGVPNTFSWVLILLIKVLAASFVCVQFKYSGWPCPLNHGTERNLELTGGLAYKLCKSFRAGICVECESHCWGLKALPKNIDR